MERDKKLARERAMVILSVRGGSITAREGAKQLGISRKSYYKWEERALRAMAGTLENRPAGRPATQEDPEKEQLRDRVEELEKKLLLAQKTIEVKEMFVAYEAFRNKKKAETNRKRGKRS